MAKIKNDPGRYLTRASLGGRHAAAAGSKKDEPGRVRTAQDFREAHVDDGMYVTFNTRDRQTKDR